MENLEFTFPVAKKPPVAFHVLFKHFFSLKSTDLRASLILSVFTSCHCVENTQATVPQAGVTSGDAHQHPFAFRVQ